MALSAQDEPYVTPVEYLERERLAETKNEYWNGEITAMAGASPRHTMIVANLAYLFISQLKGRPCTVHVTDLRVKVSPTGLYTYPDVTVICGNLEVEDEQQDTALNPSVIIEVLSPSTENYDRGQKFAHYRTLESLSDYIMVIQDVAQVEHYARQSADQWLLTVYRGLESVVMVESIGCEMRLADVYDKVELGDVGMPASTVSVLKEDVGEYQAG